MSIFIYYIISAAELPCPLGFTVLSFHFERKLVIDVIIGPIFWLHLEIESNKGGCFVASHAIFQAIYLSERSLPLCPASNCEHWWLSVPVHVLSMFG